MSWGGFRSNTPKKVVKGTEAHGAGESNAEPASPSAVSQGSQSTVGSPQGWSLVPRSDLIDQNMNKLDLKQGASFVTNAGASLGTSIFSGVTRPEGLGAQAGKFKGSAEDAAKDALEEGSRLYESLFQRKDRQDPNENLYGALARGDEDEQDEGEEDEEIPWHDDRDEPEGKYFQNRSPKASRRGREAKKKRRQAIEQKGLQHDYTGIGKHTPEAAPGSHQRGDQGEGSLHGQGAVGLEEPQNDLHGEGIPSTSLHQPRKQLDDALRRLFLPEPELGQEQKEQTKDANQSAEISELRRQLKKAQSDSQAQLNEKLALQEQIARLRSSNANYDLFYQENEKLKKLNVQLQSKVNSLSQENIIFSQVKATLAQEERILPEEKSIRISGDQVVVYRERDSLSREKAALESSVASLSKQNTDLVREVGVLSGKLNSANTDVATFKLQADSAVAALKSNNVEMDNMRKDAERIQRERTELSRKLQLSRSEVFTLQEKLRTAESQRNSAVNDISSVISQLRQSQSANRDKDAKVTDLEGISKGLRAMLESSEAELQELKARHIPRNYDDQVAEIKRQLEEKSQQVRELTKQINGQEERIQRAQEAAFKNLNSIKHNFLDDTQVKDQLENDFFGRLFLWTQTYVPKKKAVNLQDKQLEDQLKFIANPKDIRQLVQKRPRTVLQGMLYHFVTKYVFSPPFYLYSLEGQTGAESSTGLLQNLYNTFLKVDEIGCHTWRFHTFQLLEGLRKQSPESAGSPTDDTASQQAKYCERLAQEFVAGPAKAFFGGCESEGERLQELSEAFNSIASLSSRLWSQRVFLKIHGYDHFKDAPYNGSSPHMRAHSIHLLEINGENSRDGASIAMVVQPEIAAYGNEEGEDYDKERVWSQAVVMLGDD
ncbi:hypothetical protein ABW19_dt0207717 [Dactylella cylindrospora]|nr:hypothetical protein ABW19_dt0207717 [Dactylella cylindrospora]